MARLTPVEMTRQNTPTEISLHWGLASDNNLTIDDASGIPSGSFFSFFFDTSAESLGLTVTSEGGAAWVGEGVLTVVDGDGGSDVG